MLLARPLSLTHRIATFILKAPSLPRRLGRLVLWLFLFYVHHCEFVVCLAAIVRMARFGWLLARSWLCCAVGCLLVVAPCAIVAVVVVLAGGVFPGFTPAVPEKQLEPQSVHELLGRAAVVASSSWTSRSTLAALAVLAPFALAPLGLDSAGCTDSVGCTDSGSPRPPPLPPLLRRGARRTHRR